MTPSKINPVLHTLDTEEDLAAVEEKRAKSKNNLHQRYVRHHRGANNESVSGGKEVKNIIITQLIHNIINNNNTGQTRLHSKGRSKDRTMPSQQATQKSTANDGNTSRIS
jgi:hypothetical protein